MTPLVNAILGRVDERLAGAASGLVSTVQQVGGAIGVAVVSIVFFAAIGLAAAHGASEARPMPSASRRPPSTAPWPWPRRHFSSRACPPAPDERAWALPRAGCATIGA
jgi:hypothetical protein